MTRLFFTFLCVILLYSNQIAQAQKNYLPGNIVDLKGDTVQGFIEYLDWHINPEQINFKRNPDSERITFKPEEITGFEFSEFIYRTRLVQVTTMTRNEHNATNQTMPDSKKELKFLKLIVESKVSLYQLIDQVDIDHYYLDVPGDTLIELIFFKYIVEKNGVRSVTSNTKYKGQLTYYLQDCKDIQKTIREIDYTAEDFSMIIFSYNQCHGDPIRYHYNFSEKTTHKRKKSSIKIGAYLGMVYNLYKFQGSGDLASVPASAFSNKLKPAFGLLLNIEPAVARGRWSIVLDLIVRGCGASANYTEVLSDSWTRKYDIDINETYLTLTPMYRYYFNTGNVRPYLNGGLFIGSIVAANNSAKIEEYYYGETRYDENNLYRQGSVDIGLSLGGGVYYKKFSIDLRYHLQTDGTLQSLMFMLGYTFNAGKESYSAN